MHMLYDSDAYVVVQLKPSPADDAAQPLRVQSAVEQALRLSNGPELEIKTHAESSFEQAAKQQHLRRDGFEIVDKQRGREVYLDGSWAEMFQAQLDAWQQRTPSQEEVEATLEGYAALAQNPVRLH